MKISDNNLKYRCKLTFFLITDGSRGGFDEVDNELDYGWQENEAPLKQEIENEKLQQVKTDPDGMHLLVF